jgi:hypothetical protein
MTAVIYAIAGLAVVLLTSLVKREHWSAKTKTSLLTILSTVAGYITIYFDKNGTTTLLNTLNHSSIVLAASHLVYSLGFKGTPLDKFLTKINSIATAPSATVK